MNNQPRFDETYLQQQQHGSSWHSPRPHHTHGLSSPVNYGMADPSPFSPIPPVPLPARPEAASSLPATSAEATMAYLTHLLAAAESAPPSSAAHQDVALLRFQLESIVSASKRQDEYRAAAAHTVKREVEAAAQQRIAPSDDVIDLTCSPRGSSAPRPVPADVKFESIDGVDHHASKKIRPTAPAATTAADSENINTEFHNPRNPPGTTMAASMHIPFPLPMKTKRKSVSKKKKQSMELTTPLELQNAWLQPAPYMKQQEQQTDIPQPHVPSKFVPPTTAVTQQHQSHQPPQQVPFQVSPHHSEVIDYNIPSHPLVSHSGLDELASPPLHHVPHPDYVDVFDPSLVLPPPSHMEGPWSPIPTMWSTEQQQFVQQQEVNEVQTPQPSHAHDEPPVAHQPLPSVSSPPFVASAAPSYRDAVSDPHVDSDDDGGVGVIDLTGPPVRDTSCEQPSTMIDDVSSTANVDTSSLASSPPPPPSVAPSTSSTSTSATNLSKAFLANLLREDSISLLKQQFQTGAFSPAAAREQLLWMAASLTDAKDQAELLASLSNLSLASGAPVEAPSILPAEQIEAFSSVASVGGGGGSSIATGGMNGGGSVTSPSIITSNDTLPGYMLSPREAAPDDRDFVARMTWTLYIPRSSATDDGVHAPPIGPKKRKKSINARMDETPSHDHGDEVVSPVASIVSGGGGGPSTPVVPITTRQPMRHIDLMLQVNLAWERLCGYTQSEMVDILHAKQMGLMFEHIRSDHIVAMHRLTQRFGIQCATEAHLYLVRLHPDGSEFYCLVHLRMALDQGILLKAVASFLPLPEDPLRPPPPFIEGRDLDEETLLYGYRPQSKE